MISKSRPRGAFSDRRLHVKRGRLVRPTLVLAAVACLGWHMPGQAAETEVHWANEWVVFAPMARNHPLVAPEKLRSVPATIVLPGTELQPGIALTGRRVKASPGAPVDLSAEVGREKGSTAYVFAVLESSTARAVTLGLGGDWWLQCWLNGEEIFNTGEQGNEKAPFGILNHKVPARLRAGRNVLAVRFSRGVSSAMLALGDASHFPAEQARLAALEAERSLNTLPKTLAERLVFPAEEQAVATASWSIDLDLPDADLAAGALVGLRAMPRRQAYLHRGQMLDTLQRRFDEPVTIRLSKYRYPFEDRHLDAIVWTTPPQGANRSGRLEARLLDGAGTTLAQHQIPKLSETGWFFSLGFPPRLAGRAGALEVIWLDGQRELGRAQAPFHVSAPAEVAVSGRVPLHVINEPGAVVAGAPMTVGVPFARGALADAANVRLVDDGGAEVPVQARVTARWSRFGAVKWLLCDFTADLAGRPREFFLEYGPTVRRAQRPPLAVTATAAGFPLLDAGRLRVTARGIEFDAAGKGAPAPVFGPGALRGALVRHEDNRVFAVPADVAHAIEEIGSEKAVVRRTGWYVEEGSGKRFCQFVTRFAFHRNSPAVRIFHTWIFTGDGNRDRIREMGWRFETARAPASEGFLASFETGQWLEGSHLVQHDYQRFDLAGRSNVGGRTPGVLSAKVGAVRVLFGAKDFWQNFPSELEFDSGGFTFYNWPRHNPPASFRRPVTPDKAFLHRFAHEGRVLDFRLPNEYAEGAIWQEACGREGHWARGKPETANAQGIALTEEMFLYFTNPSVSREAAARVMHGLNDESLRAVVDPAWVAASGAFGNIHHCDREKYAEDEHLYEQVVHAPARWNERLGFYGKWLHGDVPAWNIDLEKRTVSLYRTIRKNHHGWPVGWLPYARSGDPRLLKYAEAATRQMTDSNFCHYADEAVEASLAPDYYRRQGWWLRSLLPWTGSRGPQTRTYTVDCDYIWHAYYLTGYARARDVALLFGELTKQDHVAVTQPSRITCSMLPSYLEMYQATWDPWFLDGAHTIARLHLRGYAQEKALDRLTHESPGHFWRPADEAFHRFTGDDGYRLLALNHSVGYSSPRSYGFGGLWSRMSVPYITQAAYAWELTGDDYFLGRVAAYLDWARRGVYDGEPEYLRGSIVQAGTARGVFTGYYIKQFPLALGAFERAGCRPEPIPNPFFVKGDRVPGEGEDLFHFRLPEVIVRKQGNQPISLSLTAEHRDEKQPYYYEITAPGGGRYLAGTWPLDFKPRTVDIAAAAPAGDYRLVMGGRVPLGGSGDDRARTMRRHGGILLPAAEPHVPEVMAFHRTPDGTRVALGGPEIQYWFLVPEGVSEFWIEFRGGSGRVSVWNPDRQRTWDRSYTGSSPGRVMIHVPPGHAGRVWGASGGVFVIDPRIPPYFSTSRVKWFNPEEK